MCHVDSSRVNVIYLFAPSFLGRCSEPQKFVFLTGSQRDVPNGLETVILKTQSVGHAEEREDNARTVDAWRGGTNQEERLAS